MQNICLSICIPTKGRSDVLKNTLDSIYVDNLVDYDEFEVVISDSSDTSSVSEMLTAYSHYPNIVYKKNASEGFLNLICALKMGKGTFLKLHNDYTVFKNGALASMIKFAKNEATIKPLVFFSNNELRKNEVLRYNSFDTFTYELSFFNTWATGFSIWKQDFDKHSSMDVSQLFPHTSLLLLQHDKGSFVINDRSLFTHQEVSKKGGYNLFDAFAVQYLKMMEGCLKKNQITINTFNHIKQDLFDNFLVIWYYNTKIAANQYTFDLSGIKASIKIYYSEASYYRMIIVAYKKDFLKNAKRAAGAIKRRSKRMFAR
ncbi:glycosyltransferase family 2 protein [Mucilaginibacter angelicae]|uniref:Glycosyltransferase family 2 protein n=1 Tax=Mucilaginibacter angelicae TaxID=869718 RepID=A0ABV6L5T1_9SPHI